MANLGIKSTNGFHKPPSFAHVLKDSNVHRFSSPDFTNATCNMVQPCNIANPSEVAASWSVSCRMGSWPPAKNKTWIQAAKPHQSFNQMAA